MQFDFDFFNLEKTVFCTHRFFSYSFTSSDGSEGTTEGCVVSPHSIMVRHGFRCKQERFARKQNIDHVKHHDTPHCWLPAMVMYLVNSTKHFSWLTSSTSNFVVEERSDIYIL